MRGGRILVLVVFLGCSSFSAAAQQPADQVPDSSNSLPSDTEKVNLLLKEVLAQHFKSQSPPLSKTDTLLHEAILLAQQINDAHGLAVAYDLTGVEERENSEYLLAIDYHRKALSLARSLKDNYLIAETLNNMGVAYRHLDENQKAFECHLQALQTAEKINDRKDITVATNSLGNIELSMGRYYDAIEQFNRSLEMETEQQNSNGIALNLANLGLAYEGLGQLDRAIQNFTQSLAMNESNHNQRGIGICYNSLGEAYEKKGNYVLALDYFNKAIQANGQALDRIDISQNYLSRGNLMLRTGRFSEGIASLDTSLRIATRIGSKSLALSAMSALGTAWTQRGNYRRALQYMKHSLPLNDSILNGAFTLHLAEMQALYELDRKDNQIKLLKEESSLRQMQSRRNWFLALVAFLLSLAGSIAGFFYMRHRELLSHRRALELELRSLRSQMNPHFIFNSLNSIHKYIWSNQTEEASEYLTKFSRLMRIILENTQHAQVLLSKELQSLFLYLELECLRCSNKFSYQIQVDPSINQDDVMIPPLIIQPFVENAIWHGLVHRDGTGKLLIDISLRDKMFICTVSDNGIGRRKAMEIRQRKGPVHQSMGMKVTQERIKLTSELNRNKETNIEITDMQDETGNAMGTRVTVRLPAEFLF
jgi:tetratricopeptide (TPR) repeat protein